jgi:hypothetical protein
MPVFQHNDIDLEVSLAQRSGAEIDATTITAAEYRLYNVTKTEALVTKTLGSGITTTPALLIVTLSAVDTQTLRGVYYHELRIEIGGKAATVISENINLKATEI